MGKPSTIKFDIDQMEKMKTAVSTTRNDLQRTKNDLIQSINELQGKWNTPAGKKFFESVNLDWSPEIEKYCKILDAVEDCLQVAINDYTEVEDAVRNIKF